MTQPKQATMWTAGEDLPLFTGQAQTVYEKPFNPRQIEFTVQRSECDGRTMWWVERNGEPSIRYAFNEGVFGYQNAGSKTTILTPWIKTLRAAEAYVAEEVAYLNRAAEERERL